ncbi:hypothetical protein L596_020577 [Steinernema carpocapsae]|uniref:Uncharacterized protein n=1 Tax=Steinernema carpocapsae TaxID=34508 RepID=A0A4U5MUL5_STECR|nr:hypothetical protein L596_020577 [Steinernema carpocapsae]
MANDPISDLLGGLLGGGGGGGGSNDLLGGLLGPVTGLLGGSGSPVEQLTGRRHQGFRMPDAFVVAAAIPGVT